MGELPICEQLRETAHAISQYTPEDAETGKIMAGAADTISALYEALKALAQEVATTAMPEASCERLFPYALKANAALSLATGESPNA